MNHDYWADNFGTLPDGTIIDGGPATFGDLTSKLKKGIGYQRERTIEEGEVELKYFWGRIIVRGRLPEDSAYKLTIAPKGIFRWTDKRNLNTLKSIIQEAEIKLTEVRTYD